VSVQEPGPDRYRDVGVTRADGPPRRSRLTRAVLPVLVAGAAAGALAGCEKPTPLVTMQAGATFVKTDAAQYLRNGTIVTDSSFSAPTLRATPGERLNIDVPKSVASHGFFVTYENQRISEVITAQHYGFTVPNAIGSGELTIFQAPTTGSTNATGSWPFRLVIQP
jgi:hypothetical protein